ncbi:flagellar motor protein MotB [Novosphingobium album (ex Liu et al. 2023)]|uniref:Flagellar motor protein MotB n=1 Tax=Novosphingobium album (ex Liu et al. 2023) TaxID=3031130 RepID=A0ABT5WM70_9SPHN|nr:flagellar motor protein MotB [Novosphingobium album (ex Liu et al. 2023)]MDE8651141.1 flagellar motor protein MotB [Novosphingobium album (ex Liu et al. 2023)]
MATPKRGKNEPPPPIIVKKITVVAGGHHGGAWKVAYADFVTAMMAFFLLLWILGATTEKQRKGIADYFTPTLVKTREASAGSAAGVLGGSSLVDADNYPHQAGQTGTRAMTIPRDATGGPKEGGTKIKRTARAKQAIQQKLASSEALRRLAKQVRLVDTTEGVRIDMVDDANFSMFRLGTTILTPDASELLRAIADAVGQDAGSLTIRGHTDALPWRAGMSGNNWSLSAGRAEATRQALMSDGIAESRFRRIEGVADRELLIPNDPADPRNRRISITLLD